MIWYERVTAESAAGVRDRITRLTEQIDRAELSKTRSALFAPDIDRAAVEPSPAAWVQIPESASAFD